MRPGKADRGICTSFTGRAQRWHEPGDGTLRALGKCLDVQSGGTANGTPAQLFDCNGSGAQTWVSQANGSLLNPQSGRCLDDPGNKQSAGDPLQIYDCNGTIAQLEGPRRRAHREPGRGARRPLHRLRAAGNRPQGQRGPEPAGVVT
jgi:hypothetical protein